MVDGEAAVVGRGVVSAAAVWRGEPLGHAVATTTAGLLVAGSNGAVGTAAHASCRGVVLGNEPGIDAGHTGCDGDVVGNDHKLWDLAGVGERPVGVLNVAGDCHVMLNGIDDHPLAASESWVTARVDGDITLGRVGTDVGPFWKTVNGEIGAGWDKCRACWGTREDRGDVGERGVAVIVATIGVGTSGSFCEAVGTPGTLGRAWVPCCWHVKA